MILTCPECGTQYVVKDGAIPAGGRQVRCANCRHSWHQDPEPLDLAELEAPAALPPTEELAEEQQPEPASSWSGETVEDGAATIEHEPAAEPDDRREAADAEFEPLTAAETEARPAGEPNVAEPWTPRGDRRDDEFSPFAERGPEAREARSPLVKALAVVLLIAALAAAFWFLAPSSWKERVGLSGFGTTPLQLMMTHSDRQALASGNELLQVSGRVINPTDEDQPVPPIYAQLKNGSGELIYTWTIAPPARTLPPRASATFNSAEVNVPSGGEELTITLGSPGA